MSVDKGREGVDEGKERKRAESDVGLIHRANASMVNFFHIMLNKKIVILLFVTIQLVYIIDPSMPFSIMFGNDIYSR